MHTAIYKAWFGITRKSSLLPKSLSNHFDCILFSDTNPNDESFSIYEEITPQGNKYSLENRRLKIHAEHQRLSKYDYTIYMDDNISVETDELHKLVPEWLSEHSFALFKHPLRNCLYKEARAILEYRKSAPMPVIKQAISHKQNGFPANYGLSECSILIRNNRCPKVKAFNKLWWETYQKGSGRDQLAFDYARWKLDFKVNYLQGSVDENPWFKRHVPEGGYRRAQLSRLERIQRKITLSPAANPFWRWLQG